MDRQGVALSLAAYLPQFHEIPENNRWWGQGFTEWTKLGQWQPYRQGHRLRRPVAPLGQYNLLDQGVMEAQYDLAAQHGIDGFAVWDYWFGHGQRLLEQPLEKVLRDRLRFRYCIAWANHTWLNRKTNEVLREQQYLGAADYKRYFEHCDRHFQTDNYIRVGNRPVFFIYNPNLVPDLAVFCEVFNQEARVRGYDGIYFMADQVAEGDAIATYFDKVSNGFAFWTNRKKLYWNFVKEKARTKLNLAWAPQFYDYWGMVHDAIPERAGQQYMPTAIAGWDTSPRHAARGVVFDDFTPEAFARHLEHIRQFFVRNPANEAVVFLKSWNEWAEGNCIEPDDLHGAGFLQAYKTFSAGLRELQHG